MKHVLLLISVSLLASVQLIFSQVVINKSDFPFYSSYTSAGFTSLQEDITAPAIGENQTWDLSDLQVDIEYSTEYYDATDDIFYTDAIYYVPTTYNLNQFVISSFDFYKLDDVGYTKEGRRIEEIVYPITQLTGGPNDILKIVGGDIPFIGRLDYIQFPLEFGKSWTHSYRINTNYELTVEAYGLNSTPGQFFQIFTQTRTVVGSGKLTMPNKDGGIMTIDALLIKVNSSSLDSVYLGGQPAPPQLMALFGLEQGNVASEEYYTYYAPGYGESVASYDVENSYIKYQSLSQITSSVETEQFNKLSVYPNPVKIGSILNIADSKVKLTNIELVDQSGKVVLENEMSGNASLSIPNTITAGAYLLNSYDSNGKIVSSNKIIIE